MHLDLDLVRSMLFSHLIFPTQIGWATLPHTLLPCLSTDTPTMTLRLR